MRNLFLAGLAMFAALAYGVSKAESTDARRSDLASSNNLEIVLVVPVLEEVLMRSTESIDVVKELERKANSKKFAAAVSVMQAGLVESFGSAGVRVTVRVIRDRSDIKTLSSQSPAGKALHLRILSYMTSSDMGDIASAKGGEIFWEIGRYDANGAFKPLGGAGGPTLLGRVRFKQSCDDGFKECGDQFAKSVVNTLKADGFFSFAPSQ